MNSRAEIIGKIVSERLRQIELPGSEFDQRNTPNDWATIVLHYVGEEIRRGVSKPSKSGFEDAFIKAAAVITAALEHIDDMSQRGDFRAE